jgi:hypothetical protein
MLRVRGYKSTVGFVDLDELLEEGFNGLRGRAATTLDTADTPRLDRTLLVVHGELATVQPPATGDHVSRLDGGFLGTGAEVNSGHREDTSRHIGCIRKEIEAGTLVYYVLYVPNTYPLLQRLVNVRVDVWQLRQL